MVFKNEKDYRIYLGDLLEVLDELPDNVVDAVVTDPPYEINFMNKGWDRSGIVLQVETWKKVLRVLKPGGHILVFNHSRMFHRVAVAIEDAGFEIRDTIMWMYGSGFPKSHNISKAIESKLKTGKSNSVALRKTEQEGGGEPYTLKGKNNGILGETREYQRKTFEPSTEQAQQWQGWGTALKPSYEPIILARKPLAEKTIAENVLKYGVGGINIDDCRVGTEERTQFSGKGTNGGVYHEYPQDNAHWETVNGRFPANTIHDGSEEVTDLFPETTSSGGSFKAGDYQERETSTNFTRGDFIGRNDSGSASRFFYKAKANKKDRDEGLDIEPKYPAAAEFRPNHMEKAKQGDDGNPYGRWQPRKNTHPTVKPTELMQYLVRLITPKGGLVLDPFMGSGSTGKATMIENNERNAGYMFIGIDIVEEYCQIAEARIEFGKNYKEEEEENGKSKK